MSEVKKAVCIICGRQYDVCLSCKDQDKIKPWRSITDFAVCYKIFLAITQYNNGYISKEEAKRQLEEFKFNKSDLKDSVRAKVDEIMSVSVSRSKKSSKANDVKTENIENTETVENENDCE